MNLMNLNREWDLKFGNDTINSIQNGTINNEINDSKMTMDDVDQEYDLSNDSKIDYLQHIELEYTPNIVRWFRPNFLSQIDNAERHTVLIGGYNHCSEYYLEALSYGKDGNSNKIIIERDNSLLMQSQIADIQFANENVAVVAMRDGQIQLIQLEQSESDSFEHKWKFKKLTKNKQITCQPIKNDNNNYYKCNNAKLTSVAVSTICGKIVAADQNGYTFITDLEQQKTVKSQRCSSSAINDIGFADKDTIAAVTMSGQLMLWDIRDMSNVKYHTNLDKKYGSLTSLAIHPHGNHIFATGTENGSIARWDLRGNGTHNIWNAHEQTIVNDLKFLTNMTSSINGLVSCGNDGIAQTWTAKNDNDWKDVTKLQHLCIQEEKYAVTSLDFFEQIGVVATCCDSQMLTFLPTTITI